MGKLTSRTETWSRLIRAASLIVAACWADAARGVDCNANGRTDECDISCTAPGCAGVTQCGTSNDCNANQVPDECDTFPAAPVASVLVASSDVSEPLFCGAPRGDSRLWIVQHDGRIKILSGGAVLPTPYLDISGLISTSGEQGLLGLAFDPNFNSNARFYVHYTNTSGTIVIARYRATAANPASNTADPSSGLILKTISHPTYVNHNGGCLQFGPDGFLYCGIGDGGGANDPNNRAQDPNSLLGKMLRLDVNNPPTYVPVSNPYVGPGAPRDEIWSMGWRNPWRFSFDRLTGAIYVGDVGQSAHEEIDFEPAATAGRNYGWRCMEGDSCTGLSGCTCNGANLTMPILDNPQTTGACAVIGGYVYRGCAIPGLQGTYFYADLCANYIKSFRYSPATGITQHVDRTTELAPDQGAVQTIVSFGEDGFGELYYCSYANGGGVYKIVPGVSVCGNNVVETGEECDDGNTVSGDGCDASCHMEQATSACCFVDGTCTVETTSACNAAGGVFQGDGSDCSPNACPQPTGACCAANDTCSVAQESDCLATGGTYQGDGTTCASSSCTAQPVCADIRRLKAQCGSDGVQVLVVLHNADHSGQTVTVSVNGVQSVLTIAGRLASGNVCCPHGSITVSLVNPGGCVPPVSLNCP